MKFEKTTVAQKRINESVTHSFAISTDHLPEGHFRKRIEWHLAAVGDFFERNAAQLRKLFGEAIVLKLSTDAQASPAMQAVPGGKSEFTAAKTDEVVDYINALLARISGHSERVLGQEHRIGGTPRCRFELEDSETFSTAIPESDPDEGLPAELAAFNRSVRENKPKTEVDDAFISPALARFNESHRSRT